MVKYKLIAFVILIFFSKLFAENLVHVIAPGETLYSLSRRYNVPVSLILETNNIKDSTKIKAGQKLLIPNTIKEGFSSSKKTEVEKHSASQKKPSFSWADTEKKFTYKIEKGDTLFGIAKKQGINFSALLRVNGFSEDTVIKAGQLIRLPDERESAYGTAKKPAKTKIHGVSPSSGSAKRASQGFVPSSNTKSKKNGSQILSASSEKADPALLWPVPASEVSYLSGKITGVVIDSARGQEVKSIASGKVVSTGTHRGFGQVVFIQLKTKHIYVYAGLNTVNVKKGDSVKTGTKLGELGSELFTGKAKLYFMVYKKNTPIDPQKAPRGI